MKTAVAVASVRAVCCWALLMSAVDGRTVTKQKPIKFKTTPLCELGPTLKLEGHGQMASVGVALDPLEDKPECEVHVVAPPTHVVGLVFDEVKVGATKSRRFSESEEPCPMSIYLPDKPNTPFWKGDPCSSEVLPEVELLTNDFKIVWSPPENPWNTVGRTFYLTAIGSGAVCQEEFQLACLRIGRVPMLCVSRGLACDGRRHCPRTAAAPGASPIAPDEDPRLCKPPVAAAPAGSWEGLLREIVKGFKPPANGTTDSTWIDWSHHKNGSRTSTEVIEETHNTGETISQMLNKYGPWGYLMLGLLICGTVLFFCGLWECCCRRPKTETDPPPCSAPAAVLVVGCGTPVPLRPPNYDDLDLPPSYGTLFPHVVHVQETGEVQEQEEEEETHEVVEAEQQEEETKQGGSEERQGGETVT